VNLDTSDEILRSTVRLARLSFGAAAASVFLRDQANGTLVFEASSGVGEDHLIGVTIPGDQGIAGWVASTGETMIVRGAADDPRFDRDFARSTGLIPDVIMAVPMEHQGQVLGVLEVLDPKTGGIGDLDAMDLLGELANQSSAALTLVLEKRRRTAAVASSPSDDALARIDAAARAVGGPSAAATRALLEAVADLLEAQHG
jgi:GAF domain-containing protein